jgi:hypothetical protein
MPTPKSMRANYVLEREEENLSMARFMVKPHIREATEKITRFVRKLKFRLNVNQAIIDRVNAKRVLLDLVFLWRNKARNLTRKEHHKWIYFRWLMSARRRRREDYTQKLAMLKRSQERQNNLK